MLPPERRLPGVREAIDQQEYFVVHAPRQVGKTTALLALGSALTGEGRYAALLVSMETGAAFPDDVGAAEDTILGEWRLAAEFSLPPELGPPPWPDAEASSRIRAALTAWAQVCPRPLIVFLDEIDALRDLVLVSVLRRDRARRSPRPGTCSNRASPASCASTSSRPATRPIAPRRIASFAAAIRTSPRS